jgi:hypothetical protein
MATQSTEESAKPLNAENIALASIVNFFECPVCFDPVTPPIHQCNNGHILCNRCINRRPRMDNCPICRTRIPRNPKVRNLQMEAVAEVIGPQFSCDTCDNKQALSQLPGHRFQCDPIGHWRENQEMRAGVAERIGRLLDRQGYRPLVPITDFEQFVFDSSSSQEEYDRRARIMFRAIEHLTIDRWMRYLRPI